MHKNAQNVEQKTQTKICCHHTWLLHGKSCLSRRRFPRSFLPQASPVEGQSLQRKRKKRRKRKGQKKFQKKGKKQILISAHAQVKMSQTVMLVARRPSCRDASAFLTRLKLIWPRSSLKTAFFAKSSRVQWVK